MLDLYVYGDDLLDDPDALVEAAQALVAEVQGRKGDAREKRKAVNAVRALDRLAKAMPARHAEFKALTLEVGNAVFDLTAKQMGGLT